MRIEDGTGINGSARVDEHNLLGVKSASLNYASFISFLTGEDVIWNSSYSATANDYVFCIRNLNQTKKLKISKIIFSNSVDSFFNVSKVTVFPTSGTSIVGYCTNFASGIVPTVSCYGDAAISGITAEKIIKISTPAYNSLCLNLDGRLILSSNSGIAVQCLNSGTVSISLCGWFE